MKYRVKLTDNWSAASRGFEEDTITYRTFVAKNDEEALKKALKTYLKVYDCFVLNYNDELMIVNNNDTEVEENDEIIDINNLKTDVILDLLYCSDPGFGSPFVMWVKNENNKFIFESEIE